jgi:hypothetical protein
MARKGGGGDGHQKSWDRPSCTDEAILESISDGVFTVDGKAIIGRSGYFIDADGNRFPISISTAVLLDAMEKVIGGAETFRDLCC